jgi:hypothetical protein
VPAAPRQSKRDCLGYPAATRGHHDGSSCADATCRSSGIVSATGERFLSSLENLLCLRHPDNLKEIVWATLLQSQLTTYLEQIVSNRGHPFIFENQPVSPVMSLLSQKTDAHD